MTAVRVAELVGAELADYAELIAAPGDALVGFMPHGDGPGFTERVAAALQVLGLPEEACAHHRALANWFAHARGFFKAEWRRRGDAVEASASLYFQRRPPVGEVVARLRGLGVAAAALDHVPGWPRCSRRRPPTSSPRRCDRPVEHKVYLTQWQAADTRDAVEARLGRALAACGVASDARALWAARHAETCCRHDATLYASVSVGREGATPGLKLDYADVAAERAAAWAPADDRAGALEVARRVMAAAGTLTYLGVRLAADRAAPGLKFYCDRRLPGVRRGVGGVRVLGARRRHPPRGAGDDRRRP